MRAFAELYRRLDASNRTNEKVAALRAYFSQAPDADAAWTLYFLTGNKVRTSIRTRLLREWIAELAELPLWLVEECYETVGDLAETLSLLASGVSKDGTDQPLHQLVEERLLPLREADDTQRHALLLGAWKALNAPQCFLWNKLITGGFRVGVARTLVARALAEVAGVETATMSHRIMGYSSPDAATYRQILEGGASADDGPRPYPFFLANPVEADPASLGDASDWQAEWKWDGIRAQLIKRNGALWLWSRGEELVHGAFPEIVEDGAGLPDGVVLDGELLAWREEGPLPFAELQRRLKRKSIGPTLRKQVPVCFLAFDLLEQKSADRRNEPLHVRRAALEALLENAPATLRLSPTVPFADWPTLADLRSASRQRGVEGLMLKRLASPYRVGRPKGDWWKWKIDPLTIDAVLTYAQRGHGRRAGLYSDYTFGVWAGAELVTLAKAYSGLSDAEIREVDRFVRQHTLERYGPVRRVTPALVFELAFEGIRASPRHKAGVALRFPRMQRWRKDKPADQANTLEQVKALLPPQAP